MSHQAPHTDVSDLKQSRKERILAVAVEMLRGREEILVAEIARRAEVSVGLIYRHFGDLDALVQEAWAEIFLSFEMQDEAIVASILADPHASVSDLIEWAISIYSAERDDSGWMRLEALVASRSARVPMPAVEAIRTRIMGVYRELVHHVGLVPAEGWSEDKIEAVLVVLSGLPLGATSMMPRDMTEGARRELGAAYVRAAFGALEVDLEKYFDR